MSARAARPAAAEGDGLPEADRLEGAPHPRETRVLLGHESAERALARALASGRIHHAWLIAGPMGIGKATLAYRLARIALDPNALARLDPETGLAAPADSPVARAVEGLFHPGLLVIRREWDPKRKRFPVTIPVEAVRRLRTFLGHTAGKDAWRVVIIDAADELGPSAANALLKSLEEPPERCLFLLVSAEPGRLLPTIRSRCRRLDLARLGERDLIAAGEAALQAVAGGDGGGSAPATAASADRGDLAALAPLAEGSVRRLLLLAQGGGQALYDSLLDLLRAMPRPDQAALHALADTLSAPKAEQSFETFFALLRDLLARVVRHGATGTGAIGEKEADIAARLIRPDTLADWAALWETIGREMASARALNLDRRTLVLETLLRLEALARGDRAGAGLERHG